MYKNYKNVTFEIYVLYGKPKKQTYSSSIQKKKKLNDFQVFSDRKFSSIKLSQSS